MQKTFCDVCEKEIIESNKVHEKVDAFISRNIVINVGGRKLLRYTFTLNLDNMPDSGEIADAREIADVCFDCYVAGIDKVKERLLGEMKIL